MTACKIAEFEVTASGFKWIAVHTRREDEQARLLDMLTAIQQREWEER